MDILMILGIIFLIFVVVLIFSRDFRDWVIEQLGAIVDLMAVYLPIIWQAIIRGLTIYGIAVLIAGLISFILVISAIAIGSPGFTAFAFLTAIGLCLLVWFPAGVILRIFRVNSAIVPPSLKAFIAWTAFIGFVGLLYPDLITFKSLAGVAFFALIAMGLTTKIRVLDKIVFPLVIAMLLAYGWEYFFPENFRTTVRYITSTDQVFGAWKDRRSIENETQAAATYGRLVRDTKVLYAVKIEGDTINDLYFINLPLKKDTLVKVLNHKKEVMVFQGQGYIEIQLMNLNGSFAKGSCYWIEADAIRLVTPSELVAEEPQPAPAPPAANIIIPDTLYPGIHTFVMEAGAISGPKFAKGSRVCAFSDNGDMFEIIYPRAGAIKAWLPGSLPHEKDFFIHSLRKQRVTIKIS